MTRRLWKAAEMLRIRFSTRAQVGYVGSILQKCPGLVNLSLRMESDVDATLLAWITFSCPNLDYYWSREIKKSKWVVLERFSL
ncbi:hypothetical protein ACFX1X_006998 [Malus domestica]